MAGKTQIGTRAITKKMFGTREITKEVVNGVVVYEKQASGYSVTINWRGSRNECCYYSLDDGTTLGTYSEALSKIGVSVLDVNGNMREMDDILNDMGNKCVYNNSIKYCALVETSC